MNTLDVDRLLREHARRWNREHPDPPPIPVRAVTDATVRGHRALTVAASAVVVLITLAVALVAARNDSPQRPQNERTQLPGTATTTQMSPPPASDIAALESRLTYLATGAGDANPRVKEYAVTTLAAVEAVTGTHDGHADPNMAVYVLYAEGAFNGASVLGNARFIGRYLTAVLAANTFDLVALEVRETKPGLRSLGPFMSLP